MQEPKKEKNPFGIVVVRGDQGCGKTRNQHVLIKFFQCDYVVDELMVSDVYQRPHKHNIDRLKKALSQHGRALILTNEPIKKIEYAMSRTFPTSFEGAFEFEEVMAAIVKTEDLSHE